jgi:hypothetical protein
MIWHYSYIALLLDLAAAFCFSNFSEAIWICAESVFVVYPGAGREVFEKEITRSKICASADATDAFESGEVARIAEAFFVRGRFVPTQGPFLLNKNAHFVQGYKAVTRRKLRSLRCRSIGDQEMEGLSDCANERKKAR